MLSSAVAFGQKPDQIPGLVLDWPSLPDCPSKEQVTLGVRQALGSATPRGLSFHARVSIEQQSKWVLRLQTESNDGTGERQLEGDSCTQVAEALAVILAMMIEPEAARAATFGESPRVAYQQGSRGTAVTVAYAVPPIGTVQLWPGAVIPRARGGSSDSGLGIAAGVVLGLGIERTPRLGVGFSADRAQGAWRWFVNANYWSQHDIDLASESQRGAHVSLGSIGASLGLRAMRGPFEIVPRLGLLGFAVRANGFGIDRPLTGTVTWWSITAGNVIRANLWGSLGMQMAFDFAVPFSRPAAQLDPGGDVLRPSRIGAQAYLAGACRF